MVAVVPPYAGQRPTSAGRARPSRPSSACRERPVYAGAVGLCAPIGNFDRPSSAQREAPAAAGYIEQTSPGHGVEPDFEQQASSLPYPPSALYNAIYRVRPLHEFVEREHERPSSPNRPRSASPGRRVERPASAKRERPASAGCVRNAPGCDIEWLGLNKEAWLGRTAAGGRSAGLLKRRGDWDRAPRFGERALTLQAKDEKGTLLFNLSHPMPPPPRPKAPRVAPRKRQESQRWQWEMWSGTRQRDSMTCSIPSPLVKAMQTQWRDASGRGARFLVVFETCQNCHEHAHWTKHDPKQYSSYKNHAMQWIKEAFPFISFMDLRCEDTEETKTMRIGAFEMYLLCPTGRNSNTSELRLLHSKLMTKKWPAAEALLARVGVALPEIVRSVTSLLQSEWSERDAVATVTEAQEWGLGSWAPLADLISKVQKVTSCLQQGQQACATGNKEALRDALRKGNDLQVSDEATTGWRDNLLSKNLVLFNMKQYAHRFRRNAEYRIAVRLLQHAVVRPLRLHLLKAAVAKARAAEMPEEDLAEVLALLPEVSEVVSSIEKALQGDDLSSLARALDRAEAFKVKDASVDTGLSKVAHLSSKARMASEMNDLVDLNASLGGWRLPSEISDEIQGSLIQADLAAILSAELVRLKLQALVDEAEKRFAARRWEALKSSVERLTNVHIDQATWQRWANALQREHNFTVMKAVSGAGAVVKSRLYTMRLQAALKAASIPIEQLEEAVANAEAHRADSSLTSKARAEVSSARQRAKAAADAAARRRVDTAEVLQYKLQSGRVRLDEVEQCSGPLWDMLADLDAAVAMRDCEAIQKAIEGWAEDKPGSDHEAFKREDSPTKAFRVAQSKIEEIRLEEMRQQLGTCVDSLSKPSGSHNVQELQQVARLARELLRNGWELTAPRRARLLALLPILAEEASDSCAARFGATVLRTISDSARIVFLLDQSKAMKSDVFNRNLKPAVGLIASEIENQAKGVLKGAVAYGPVKRVQELTTDLNTFQESVAKHVFADARDAPLAKSLRKALELFKKDTNDSVGSVRLVFNFLSREPDNPKDVQKALHVLEAQGVLVVGVAVGTGLTEDALQEYCSPGLVFHVSQPSALQKFVEDSFKSMRDVLAKAESLTPEETLKRLEEFST